MKKTVVSLLALCLLISGSSDILSKSSNKEKKEHRCCCPPCPPPTPPTPVPTPLIVGSWVLNEIVNGIPSFSVLSAYADGTLSLHRSLSIEQPVPTNFPTGNYATIEEGIWIARSSTVFQVINSSVVNIVTTGIPVSLESTNPLARALSTYTITITPDMPSMGTNGESLALTGSMVLYEADDLSFTQPILDSTTGLPFVSDITALGQNLVPSLNDLTLSRYTK